MEGRFSPPAKRFAAARWISFLISLYAARSCSGEGSSSRKRARNASPETRQMTKRSAPAGSTWRPANFMPCDAGSKTAIESNVSATLAPADAEKYIVAWKAGVLPCTALQGKGFPARRSGPAERSGSGLCSGLSRGGHARRQPRRFRRQAQNDAGIWRTNGIFPIGQGVHLTRRRKPAVRPPNLRRVSDWNFRVFIEYSYR